MLPQGLAVWESARGQNYAPSSRQPTFLGVVLSSLHTSWCACDRPHTVVSARDGRLPDGWLASLWWQQAVGVGMRWIRRLICRPFGASLMLLCSFVLAPHFDAFGQRLLWASSFAGAQGLTTQLKQEIPIPPLPIGQERHIARLLDALAQETHGVFQ
jgi:hypothetical protein